MYALSCLQRKKKTKEENAKIFNKIKNKNCVDGKPYLRLLKCN